MESPGRAFEYGQLCAMIDLLNRASASVSSIPESRLDQGITVNGISELARKMEEARHVVLKADDIASLKTSRHRDECVSPVVIRHVSVDMVLPID
jgi:hypothetical protein